MESLTYLLTLTLAGAVAYAQPLPPGAVVVASGLDNPRGLRFGNGNQLYVAEAGTGGFNDTIGVCDAQVPFPLGPLRGGLTGRVTRVNLEGDKKTIASELPSAVSSEITGNAIFGVNDVIADGNDVYVLVAAGCTKGNLNQPSALYRIAPNGNRTMVANLSAYYRANPPAILDGDHDPDGVPYAVVIRDGYFYVLNANHAVLDRISASGTISRVIDLTPQYGHITPTAMAVGLDGNIYIANVGRVPHFDGTSILIRVAGGTATTVATGLTRVLGLAVDCQGRIHALETATTGIFFPPGTGRVLRLASGGTWDVLATDLTLPTGMTIGPDGKIYLSHRGFGFGLAAGIGEVIRLSVATGCQ